MNILTGFWGVRGESLNVKLEFKWISNWFFALQSNWTEFNGQSDL